MAARTKAELLLVLITMIWGSTFVVVKSALADAAPFSFLAVRFTLAGLVLLFVLSRGRLDREAILPGVLLGLFLFGGYAGQTSGLRFTTPSKAAFITGFSVILVPLITVFFGYRMRWANITGALLGLAGLYLLVRPPALGEVNRGDVLVLLGAISFALHIVAVGQYATRFSFRHLVTVQILVVGLAAVAINPLDPGRMLNWTPRLAAAIVVTAIFATCVAFSVQNWAQQYTPPAHTALIFALEPVFAAITSRIVLGEHLGGETLAGCLLILGGMVVSEIWGGAAPAPVEG